MESPDAYEIALRQLRRGQGLTPGAIDAQRAVSELCGLDDFERVYDRIVSTALEMGATKEAVALRTALNIGPERIPHLLTEGRRRTLIKAFQVKDERAVLYWENKGFHELRLRLGKQAEDEYRYLDAEQLVIVRERHIVENFQRRLLRATGPDVMGCNHWDEADAVIDEVEGGELLILSEAERQLVFSIQFRPPVMRNDTHRYSYRARYPRRPETDVYGFAEQSFHQPTNRFRIWVRFMDERPARVWRFKNQALGTVGGENEPLSAENLLALDPQATAYAEFAGLGNGLHTGIAWRWEPGAGS